jgi:hypothetical protein
VRAAADRVAAGERAGQAQGAAGDATTHRAHVRRCPQVVGLAERSVDRPLDLGDAVVVGVEHHDLRRRRTLLGRGAQDHEGVALDLQAGVAHHGFEGRCRLGDPLERLGSAGLALARSDLVDLLDAERSGIAEVRPCVELPPVLGTAQEQRERADLLDDRSHPRHGVVVALELVEQRTGHRHGCRSTAVTAAVPNEFPENSHARIAR